MNNENIEHMHTGIRSSCKEKKIMKSAGKWLGLECIILSEGTGTQKEKHHMFFLIYSF